MIFKWLNPARTLPPHKVTNPEHVETLADSLINSGWDKREPALVGYYHGGHIQLLSGTHRRSAAILVGLQIPVVIWPYAKIEACWGTEQWTDIMNSGNGWEAENEIYAAKRQAHV